MTLTHVTEWGLGVCAGLSLVEIKESNLKWLRRACFEETESNPYGDISFPLSEIPTCPRCAVLRDAALEGRLPERKVTHGQ